MQEFCRDDAPVDSIARRRCAAWRALGLAAAAILGMALIPFANQAAAQGPGTFLSATGYKMAGDATRMRIVVNFAEKPTVKWFLLRGPHRLVVDLPETRFAIDPDDLKPRGLVKSVRYGQLGEGRSRLIFASGGPFAVESFDTLENEEGGYRLVADLVAAPEKAFEAALARQAEETLPQGATIAKSDRIAASGDTPGPDGRFTVVIDPGHGGIDGGAEGKNGSVEKDITLAFARELRDVLAKSDRFDVHLTRDRDEFLRLDERVRTARQHAADLFISIHADTIRQKGVRGATVYTLSDRASDAEAEALASRENLSDELAGIAVEDADHQVADILVDLIRRETHGFSIRFARTLLGEMKGEVELINNPHRSAGFRVLRAPDVPSVLVELGYLSNDKDEAQLKDIEWRRRAAASISDAVDLFAAAKIAAGG